MPISNVFGFDGEIFNGFMSHHFIELTSVGGMPGHGLCLARGNGIRDFALGETLKVLADGLNHGHGGCEAHIKVGEATADAAGLAMKDDFFAMGDGDNPLATGLVADSETVLLQLGRERRLVIPLRTSHRWKRFWYQPFLVAKFVLALQSVWRVTQASFR
jgi:hypothetical protein